MHKHLQKEITLSLLSLVILFSIAFISTVSTQAQVTGRASLTVSTDPGSPLTSTVSNQSQVPILVFDLTASNSIVSIPRLSVSLSVSGDNGSSGSISNAYLYRGTVLVATTVVTSAPLTGTIAQFNLGNMQLPVDLHVPFTVKIDVGPGPQGITIRGAVNPIAIDATDNVGSIDATGGASGGDITILPSSTSTGGGGGSSGGGGSTGTPCYVFVNNLTAGSIGADVTALQQFLVTNGFLLQEFATGYFGPQTVTAVKLYQTSVGLPAYGFVGPLTIQKLNASCASGTTTTTNPIKISFYSPKKGDVLKVGQKYSIIWFSDKVANDSTFTITEFNDYGKGNIAESLTRDQVKCYGLGKGSCVYSWTPKTVSSKYQLAISQVNGGAKGQVAASGIGYSEFFSTASSTKNEKASIKLLNLNGGEVLNANKGDGKVTIKWKSTGIAETANVQIGLIDIRYSTEAGERPEQIIAYSIPNTGSYEWAIPRIQGTMDLTVTDKPVYKIILHSWAINNGNAIADASAKPFTIIAPDAVVSEGSINVTYPQAGNILDNSGTKDSGVIARIKWNSKGLGDHQIGIVLVNPSTNNTSIAKTIVATTPNTGTFDWKYDASIPNGTYAIQVYDAWSKGGSVQGTSGYFQIVNTSVTAQPVITRISAKAAEDFTVYPGQSFAIEGKNFAMANKGDTSVYFAYNGKDIAQITQNGDTLIWAITPSDLPVGKKVNLYVVNAGRVSEPVQVTVAGSVVPPVTAPFVNLLVNPTYSNGNQTVGIWAAIKGDTNNKRVSKWTLDITCSSGVTMKTPDQKEICNTQQTYYASYYYDVTQDILLLTVDANNSGTAQSTNPNVTLVLTGYDANGSSFGSDKEVLPLGFTNPSVQTSAAVWDAVRNINWLGASFSK